MNSTSYDNLESYNKAPSDNFVGAELADRLRSAISVPALPESKATTLAASEKGESKESLPIPSARIGEQGALLFCSTAVKDSTPVKDGALVKDSVPVKDSTETREQRLDQKIKDKFGAEVFDHLKDWDWLIANRKKLEDGFKKIDGQDAKWDMAWRMRDLSVVDGKPLIYLSKVDSATKGTLIPKRYDINLRRGSFRSDDYIGHVSH